MSDTPAIPLDRYPDPACSYAFDGDEPVIREANADFRERYDGGPGDSLRDCIEDDLDGGAGDSLRDCIEDDLDGDFDGHPFAEPAQYWIDEQGETLLRVVPPADGDPGFLLFSTIDEHGGLGVDRMASVVSHDLRNPLDVARARLRAGRDLDSPHHFDHVERAHDRMERIIEDVLTLARGETVVTPEDRVDLGAVVQEAWETVESDGATMTVEDELPTVVADADRVRRLFENIFRNAVEHASQDCAGNTDDRAGPTVTVSRTENGVSVADDGPGIEPANRERVFEPGYSTDEHGTGLGLAIVDRIASLHGWSVAVGRAETGGARFELTGFDVD